MNKKNILCLTLLLCAPLSQAMDVKGYNKYGYNEQGTNERGYNIFGFDSDGFNEKGCNIYDKTRKDESCEDGLLDFDELSFFDIEYKIRRSGELIYASEYKDKIFNSNQEHNSYDRNGYDDNGFDRNGVSLWGFDYNGLTPNGCNYKDNPTSPHHFFNDKVKNCDYYNYQKDKLDLLEYKYERAAYFYQKLQELKQK
jgi:hypothetical protein